MHSHIVSAYILTFLYIWQMVAKKPIFIMTWEGKDPSLSSLMLNSHTDVVPVYPVSKYIAFHLLYWHCIELEIWNNDAIKML